MTVTVIEFDKLMRDHLNKRLSMDDLQFLMGVGESMTRLEFETCLILYLDQHGLDDLEFLVSGGHNAITES